MRIQISSSQEYTVAKLGIGLRPQVCAISHLRNTIAIHYMKVGHGWPKKNSAAMAVHRAVSYGLVVGKRW